MGFNTGRNTKTQTQDDAWKASEFMNIYVPTKGGGRKKLAGVPLRESSNVEKAVMEKCATDEGREAFINSLQFEFVSATPADFELDC